VTLGRLLVVTSSYVMMSRHVILAAVALPDLVHCNQVPEELIRPTSVQVSPAGPAHVQTTLLVM
jgi:hypothetical protein